MATDETRPLSTELGLGEDGPTEPEEPTTATHRDSGDHGRPAPADTTPGATIGPYGGPVTYRRGPAPFAVFLGLLGLLVAGGVLVEEVADVTVPWNDLGPWSVVAGGLVVLLVGVIGLRANRGED